MVLFYGMVSETAVIHLEIRGEHVFLSSSVVLIMWRLVLFMYTCTVRVLVNSSTAGDDSHSGYTTVSPPLCTQCK